MAFPTLFNQPRQIDRAMCYSQDLLTRHLKDYRIYRDKEQNLIARPNELNPDKTITYLSAHMDTVDADPLEWMPPFSPFALYEDETEMVGRGVSDCKAGAAFMLFLARLAGAGKLTLSNLIFTLTFKEEGAGAKTATQMGKDLGTRLPLSNRDTFFFVLENTMTVSTPPVFSFYTAERGNFVIRISDTIEHLKSLLSRLNKWNPVSIRPEGNLSIPAQSFLTQTGGHVCSVPRDQNLLTRAIREAGSTDLLWAGDESGFGVVPPKIFKKTSATPQLHHLVLSNRSFDSQMDVAAQLEGIAHDQIKPFAISQGMNFDRAFSQHPLSEWMRDGSSQDLIIRQTHNTGASDATIVTRSMAREFTRRFYPVVMGPGTRSQREASPPRLTHGKNETFDKKTGKAGVRFLISLLEKLGHLSVTSAPEPDVFRKRLPGVP